MEIEMSGIIKSKPLPFLYVVDQDKLEQLDKACKKDAPKPYVIPVKFRPFVKRYLNRTFQEVELVDGTVLKTRDFIRRPIFYTNHIVIEKATWYNRMYFRLNSGDHVKNIVYKEHNYVLSQLSFRTNKNKDVLQVQIVGSRDILLITEIPINEKIFKNLHEIGTNIAYCIRRMSYGVYCGLWDDSYANVLLSVFSDAFLGKHPVTRRSELKDITKRFPLPAPLTIKPELLESLETLVLKIGDFTLKNYTGKKDFERLTKLAEWFDKHDYDGGFTGTGFSHCLRKSSLIDTHPEMHKLLMSYCVTRGISQWNFDLNTKTNLLDIIIKTLNFNGKDITVHCNWINIMRAVSFYKRGKIMLFDNVVAGHQLARLNELSGCVMLDTNLLNKEEIGFNKLRIQYLYNNLIKPVLFKVVREQKSI